MVVDTGPLGQAIFRRILPVQMMMDTRLLARMMVVVV